MYKSCALLRVWVACAVILYSQGASAQTIETPPVLDVGDKWTYRFHNIGDNREPYQFSSAVSAVDGTSAWIYGEDQRTNAQPPKWVWRMDLKRHEFLERFDFDPAAKNGAGKRTTDRKVDDSLQFPLSVGKKYSVKQNWDNGNGYTEYKAEVQAFEKVRVAAGEFDAFRIKYEGFWNQRVGGTFSGRAEWTRWYAPAVKGNVKSEFFDRTAQNQRWNQNATELVKWEPANTAKVPATPATAASDTK